MSTATDEEPKPKKVKPKPKIAAEVEVSVPEDVKPEPPEETRPQKVISLAKRVWEQKGQPVEAGMAKVIFRATDGFRYRVKAPMVDQNPAWEQATVQRHEV
jgi:hypothetical protein